MKDKNERLLVNGQTVRHRKKKGGLIIIGIVTLDESNWHVKITEVVRQANHPDDRKQIGDTVSGWHRYSQMLEIIDPA